MRASKFLRFKNCKWITQNFYYPPIFLPPDSDDTRRESARSSDEQCQWGWAGMPVAD